MNKAELTEFEIEDSGFKLRLCKQPSHCTTDAMHSFPIRGNHHISSVPVGIHENLEYQNQVDSSIQVIKSPMVGTFYTASTPDSPPYVNKGDKVAHDSIVCIIEAMKILNEIHAEANGVIVEILAQNGQTVEYGQPLFKIKLN